MFLLCECKPLLAKHSNRNSDPPPSVLHVWDFTGEYWTPGNIKKYDAVPSYSVHLILTAFSSLVQDFPVLDRNKLVWNKKLCLAWKYSFCSAKKKKKRAWLSHFCVITLPVAWLTGYTENHSFPKENEVNYQLFLNQQLKPHLQFSYVLHSIKAAERKKIFYLCSPPYQEIGFKEMVMLAQSSS